MNASVPTRCGEAENVVRQWCGCGTRAPRGRQLNQEVRDDVQAREKNISDRSDGSSAGRPQVNGSRLGGSALTSKTP